MSIYESAAETAKKIRSILKDKFPGIKFSVKSKTFSMGSSVDISWADGPMFDEVDQVAGMFKSGHFDGMQDMYISGSYTWTDGLEYSGAKYIMCHRDRSPELLESIKAIASEFGQTLNDRDHNYHNDLNRYEQKLWLKNNVDLSGDQIALDLSQRYRDNSGDHYSSDIYFKLSEEIDSYSEVIKEMYPITKTFETMQVFYHIAFCKLDSECKVLSTDQDNDLLSSYDLVSNDQESDDLLAGYDLLDEPEEIKPFTAHNIQLTDEEKKLAFDLQDHIANYDDRTSDILKSKFKDFVREQYQKYSFTTGYTETFSDFLEIFKNLWYYCDDCKQEYRSLQCSCKDQVDSDGPYLDLDLSDIPESKKAMFPEYAGHDPYGEIRKKVLNFALNKFVDSEYYSKDALCTQFYSDLNGVIESGSVSIDGLIKIDKISDLVLEDEELEQIQDDLNYKHISDYLTNILDYVFSFKEDIPEHDLKAFEAMYTFYNPIIEEMPAIKTCLTCNTPSDNTYCSYDCIPSEDLSIPSDVQDVFMTHFGIDQNIGYVYQLGDVFKFVETYSHGETYTHEIQKSDLYYSIDHMISYAQNNFRLFKCSEYRLQSAFNRNDDQVFDLHDISEDFPEDFNLIRSLDSGKPYKLITPYSDKEYDVLADDLYNAVNQAYELTKMIKQDRVKELEFIADCDRPGTALYIDLPFEDNVIIGKIIRSTAKSFNGRPKYFVIYNEFPDHSGLEAASCKEYETESDTLSRAIEYSQDLYIDLFEDKLQLFYKSRSGSNLIKYDMRVLLKDDEAGSMTQLSDQLFSYHAMGQEIQINTRLYDALKIAANQFKTWVSEFTAEVMAEDNDDLLAGYDLLEDDEAQVIQDTVTDHTESTFEPLHNDLLRAYDLMAFDEPIIEDAIIEDLPVIEVVKHEVIASKGSSLLHDMLNQALNSFKKVGILCRR